jgi:hypothetical protein
MQLSCGNRRRESPLHEGLEEVGGLLAVDDAGETTVLALDEDAGVKEDVHQEPRLAVREAEGGDRVRALGIGQLDRPTVRCRRQRHRRSSSMMRGCAGPRRLPPPPRPPTNPPTTR